MTDPITAEVVRNFMDSTARDIYETLVRTSQSPSVNEGKDCGAGIYSYDGVEARLVSRAGIILHSFAGLASAQTCLDFFRGDLDEGDVLLVADSHHGGSHIGDYTVLVPIFFDGRPRFFTATRLHVSDQGGPFPYGSSPLIRDIWHEGFRPGPLKLVEKGRPRRELWDWLKANNRQPHLLESDLMAMCGAGRVGDERIRALCARYGLDTVTDSLGWIFDYSERLFREQVRAWPDGTYRGEALVDADGAGRHNLLLKTAVTIDGDSFRVDYDGTADQTDGVINSVAANTTSWVCVVLSVLCPKIPINSGLFRALELELPDRSLVNAKEPVATRNGTISCGGQAGQALMKACEHFAPERVGNASEDLPLYFAFGLHQRAQSSLPAGEGEERAPEPFFFADATPSAVSGGGAFGVDGWGCWAMPFSVSSPVNIEMTEPQSPVAFHSAEYEIDSAAPGRWRGSPAFRTQRSFPGVADATVVFVSQSLVNPICGYAGGYEGAGNLMILNEGREDEQIAVDGFASPFDASSMIYALSGGGGGWGDPLDRDPERVRQDVIDEYVSVEGALADYGVVLDPEKLVVLEDETNRKRAQRRAGTEERTGRGIGREQVIRRARIQERVTPAAR